MEREGFDHVTVEERESIGIGNDTETAKERLESVLYQLVFKG